MEEEMYRIVLLDLEDRDAGTFDVEAESLDAALASAQRVRGLSPREGLLRLHVCQMINLEPQVGFVRFADGSRYDGRAAS